MAKLNLHSLITGTALVAGMSLVSITSVQAAEEHGLDFSGVKTEVSTLAGSSAQGEQSLTNRELMKKQIREIQDGLVSLFQGNYDDAMSKFMIAANNGNPAAQNSVAIMYEKGLGVEIDYAAASDWYQVAIDHGSFDALYNLAVLHAEAPYGVKKDIPKALKLFDTACEGGDTGACDYAQELRATGWQ